MEVILSDWVEVNSNALYCCKQSNSCCGRVHFPIDSSAMTFHQGDQALVSICISFCDVGEQGHLFSSHLGLSKTFHFTSEDPFKIYISFMLKPFCTFHMFPKKNKNNNIIYYNKKTLDGGVGFLLPWEGVISTLCEVMEGWFIEKAMECPQNKSFLMSEQSRGTLLCTMSNLRTKDNWTQLIKRVPPRSLVLLKPWVKFNAWNA